MATTIDEMKEMLETAMRAGQIAPQIASFDEKYKLTLPFDTYEKFNEFDRNIRENTEQRSCFVNTDINLFNYYSRKVSSETNKSETNTFLFRCIVTKI